MHEIVCRDILYETWMNGQGSKERASPSLLHERHGNLGEEECQRGQPRAPARGEDGAANGTDTLVPPITKLWAWILRRHVAVFPGEDLIIVLLVSGIPVARSKGSLRRGMRQSTPYPATVKRLLVVAVDQKSQYSPSMY
ncbi:hypothetical protein MGYG_00417 [Nannizzia gypsea CBS 118893]|uniref:Uncharacterized protein n=1 Tax=Arthroderma gypseum (strain ATCC MYA-4604 / CBS 118893) TaxID=535722 RepID=E5QZL1_ARTGP|nr:hypothetical protein MGYG_00417 [Nannizzia gypsea CBS 118893]EFQ97377.1 hypothetical protein MGYG_00417 [Nannizzia gypsea CBS 118893]